MGSSEESSLQKLLDISSEPIGPDLPGGPDAEQVRDQQLRELLATKNGFYAFGSSLHVLAAGDDSGQELIKWNDVSGWRKFYRAQIPESAVVFAQDLFANQYFSGPEGICKLTAETGEVRFRGESIEEWARIIIEDYSYETGYPIGLEWQKSNHPLRPGCRLLPKKPFVLGGDYETTNLVEIEAGVAMNKLGELSSELRDLPDGTKVELSGWL